MGEPGEDGDNGEPGPPGEKGFKGDKGGQVHFIKFNNRCRAFDKKIVYKLFKFLQKHLTLIYVILILFKNTL